MADFTGTRSDLFNCGMDSVIIEKTGCDGFAGSQGRPQELEYQLKNVFGVNKLVVFGFHSDACVYLTIESGLKRGFEIHTSQDLSYPLTRKPEEFLLGLRKKHDKLTVHQSVDELLGAIA
jgi:nicotinamidase-related amidase